MKLFDIGNRSYKNGAATFVAAPLKFYKIFKLAVILPITNNIKDFPFHVLLDERTNIKGAILCEHLRTVGLEERKYDKIEEIPEDLLEEVLEKVSLIFQ